ncbi:MAG: cytochrome bc1 complex Rieske iron-sulfur subunit [Nocardioides sp.]
MSDNHDNLPQTHRPGGVETPDPGLAPHEWRPTDVDPKAERRAERQVAGLFVAATLCLLAFLVSYFVFKIGADPTTTGGLGTSNLALGGFLGLALLFIGIGIIQWARKLMADQEIVEYRHTASSPTEDREATIGILQTGLEESGIGRRPLIRNTLLGAMGILGIAPIVLLRDLGPLPGDSLDHTIWDLNTWTAAEKEWWKGQGGRTQQRIVRDVVGTPIKASELELGDLVNAEPEVIFATDSDNQPIVEGVELQVVKSKAAVVLLRMEPGDITPGKGREGWTVNGIVAYSKICTHVGCPISLNERTTHHLLCPCHQSTFDLADSGRVLFGPAARALPQLPITVDKDGYLVAQHDFTEPVGPSFWERDSQ